MRPTPEYKRNFRTQPAQTDTKETLECIFGLWPATVSKLPLSDAALGGWRHTEEGRPLRQPPRRSLRQTLLMPGQSARGKPVKRSLHPLQSPKVANVCWQSVPPCESVTDRDPRSQPPHREILLSSNHLASMSINSADRHVLPMCHAEHQTGRAISRRPKPKRTQERTHAQPTTY